MNEYIKVAVDAMGGDNAPAGDREGGGGGRQREQ